jgi:RNA polymerase sigma factor (sigma-70 family)
VNPSRPEPDLAQQFQHWYPVVFRYFRLRGADVDTANDLAAGVFEHALRQLERFDPRRGSFAAWLFAIAHNLGVNHWRAQAAHPAETLEEWENLADGQTLPEITLVALEDREAMLAALTHLEQRERDLLALKFSARLTNRQIARMTGLSESNVGVILFRALHHLRALMLQSVEEVAHE